MGGHDFTKQPGLLLMWFRLAATLEVATVVKQEAGLSNRSSETPKEKDWPEISMEKQGNSII